MRRRSGFTLVEVLVAMALILFIMTILAAAFSAATQTVSDLKSAGDLAERLRGAATVIHRDLEATHCYRQQRQRPCRLSTIFGTSASLIQTRRRPRASSESMKGSPRYPPLERGAGVRRGRRRQQHSLLLPNDGVPGLHDHSHGTRRDDFLSAFVPGSPLTTRPNAGAARPAIPGHGQPRLQLALRRGGPVPRADERRDGRLGDGGAAPVRSVPPPAADRAAHAPIGRSSRRLPTPLLRTPRRPSNYVEISTVPTAGEAAVHAEPELQPPGRPHDAGAAVLDEPRRRQRRLPTCRAAATPPWAKSTGNIRPPTCSCPMWCRWTSASASREIRISATSATHSCRRIPTGTRRSISRTGRSCSTRGSTRRTRLAAQIIRIRPGRRRERRRASHCTRITTGPAAGTPIMIQAIQITLRVWDFKTKKTRQVTIVQQMSAPAGRSAPRRPARVNDNDVRPGPVAGRGRGECARSGERGRQPPMANSVGDG